MQKQSLVEIHQMSLRDLVQTARLFYKTLQPITAAEVAYYLATRMPGTFVAKIGKQVVGFYQAVETGEGEPLWFDFFAVNPDIRRQGIGKKLMFHFIDQAARAGYSSVELSVEKKDIEAVAFYRAYGFLEKSEQKISHRICFYQTVLTDKSNLSLSSPFALKSVQSIFNQVKSALLKTYLRLALIRGAQVL